MEGLKAWVFIDTDITCLNGSTTVKKGILDERFTIGKDLLDFVEIPDSFLDGRWSEVLIPEQLDMYPCGKEGCHL